MRRQRLQRLVERMYLSDYAYHRQLEPMAAVADVDADGLGAEIWIGTQTQPWTTQTVVETLGTSADRVQFNMMTMGGSFGRRTAFSQNYVRDALLCSKALGRPVKMTWSREDDVKQGTFRSAAAQRLEGGLTADGKLDGWYQRVATPTVIGFFNPSRWNAVKPNNVISMRALKASFTASRISRPITSSPNAKRGFRPISGFARPIRALPPRRLWMNWPRKPGGIRWISRCDWLHSPDLEFC